MATKKTPGGRKPAGKKPAKPRDLTKAEAFYVESHYGADADRLAHELAVPAEAVRAYLDQLKAAGFKPARKPKTAVEKAGFEVHDPVDEDGNPTASISVVATKASSEKGDEARKRGRNVKFFRQRVPNGIHVIDPSKPVR